MSYDELSDDTKLVVEPKADRTALAIRENIGRVESALTEFDRISASLADLAGRFPPDLVYDVSTTRGMAEAVAHRAAWRDPRINVEKFRKTAKAPVLALGKDIDARAAWLTEQLLIGETPVDEQIKAEERRKEEAKQAKINAEFGRVQAIQDAIAEIHMDAMTAASKSSNHISSELSALRTWSMPVEVFQEMMPQAIAARDSAIVKLETALKAKLHDEAEAAKVAAERAELEELRKAAAAQKAKDAEAAAIAAKAEQKRVAAEARAAQAEQARLNAEAAAARAEADKAAAAERARAQAEHEAKMKAEREVAAKKAAKAAAKQREAEMADAKLRGAAHLLLAALRALYERQDAETMAQALLAIEAAT